MANGGALTILLTFSSAHFCAQLAIYLSERTVFRTKTARLQGMKFTYVTLRRVRVTIVFMEKSIINIYPEYMSISLGIQRAKRMRRIILSSVACQDPSYLSTLSNNRHDCREKLN